MRQSGRDMRRARLAIPAAELGQIGLAAILDRADEILAGRRFAVMPVEIQIGALAEPLGPDHGQHHTDDLGALVVDGRGVEIRDFHIAVGPDGVRQRAAILGKLRGAQDAHILDPLDRLRSHMRAELLIAQHGEALFQAELEPVPAGDAIARPVVEIFMGDDAFDTVIIIVGRGVGIGQDIARVEDVEALVLHRAHVEIADGDDVEDVQVIFPAIGLLVPFHRIFQRGHGVAGALQIALAHENAQIDLAPAHGGEVIAIDDEIAGHEREQIAGFQMRIVPHGIMAAILGLAFLHQIAIGQQHGEGLGIALHPHGVARQHVGTVGMEGDAAETLRLALGAQHAIGGKQAHQLRVVRRIDVRGDRDMMRIGGQRQDQIAILHLPVVHLFTVHQHVQRRDPVALQAQRLAVGAVRIAAHVQPRMHLGGCQPEIEIQRDIGHQPCGRAVILPPDDGGRLGEGFLYVSHSGEM